jgi:hypothetical protein
MATWTQATAIPQGQLITAAWMSNVVNDVNMLGASGTSSRDMFFAIQQATQTLTTTTTNYISFGASSEIVDKANGHDTTTNNTRYICQAAGYYRIGAKIALQASSTASYVVARVMKTTGGTTTQVNGSVIVGNISTSRSVYVPLPSFIVSCAVGDYLQLNAYTDAGTVATETGGDATTFLVEWVGAS